MGAQAILAQDICFELSPAVPCKAPRFCTMSAMMARTMRTRTAAQRAAVRAYGTSLPIPQAPPGSETVFHSRMMAPKYSLSNGKWFAVFAACNVGAYAGHDFYIRFMMPTNPPNPPRDPNEARPERHMHTVDDE
eukprot:NODE_6078_length_531_cov_197.510504.p2 GENE.NODE_6078_length_531_cov_197.510504~~NODE_6078_length_531_cov_197.510504.p2  ORF type:complete len:134 (+),score=20.22 NODE_6078_length_531_cov_197.510504:3-404(+)